jgi:hypothetical protein
MQLANLGESTVASGMREKPKLSEICEVFIDESSHTKHRYLVLGGVVLMAEDNQAIQDAIAKARLPELPDKEAKWTRVSNKKLAAYKRIVDVLFDKPEIIHFHSLVVDTTKLDHRRFNDGSREIGFNKEIYQLAMKVSRCYSDHLFHLYPDYRDTNQKPNDLRLILNRGCAKSGDRRDWPFRRCQFRVSKNTPSLQLTDILIGGLAYQLNGHASAEGASPAKCELSKYILERAKIKDVTKDTGRFDRFTIWHRQLR